MQQFPFDEIDELYRKVILDHYRSPRNMVEIGEPDIEYDEYNPICGDRVVLQLKVNDGRIEEAGFHGQGCSITQASASVMTDSLKGKTPEEAEQLSSTFRRLMQGHALSEGELTGLGNLAAFQGVRKFPVRIKCALLAWTALEEGIAEYRRAGTR